MSENKHTPGPWIVVDEDYGQVIRGAEVERGQDGAKFQWRDYVGTTWGSRSVVTEANARLIAAAPELLEALIDLRSLYDTDEGCRSTPEYIAASAAIAKATGGVA